MYEVIERDKNLANQLIRSYSDMMFAGVVVGNNTGRVWVDSLENPASAIVWSDGLQSFYFMGCEANQVFYNQLQVFIEEVIINFLNEKKLNFFEFSADSKEWYPMINSALSGRDILESWQYVYKPLENSQGNDKVVMPKPYCLHQIDESFILSIRNCKMINNPEFLIHYIEQFWGSVNNFLRMGYGYVAVNEGVIVSFAITSFLYNKTFSIGVETLEQHRKKGLAGTLVNVLLKGLYSKGYTIWWDCMDSNIASQNTAKKNGLVYVYKYKICWFNF
jgi:hypothetical protein